MPARSSSTVAIALSAVVTGAVMAQSTSAYAWCRMTTSDEKPADPFQCIRAGIPLAWKRRCTEYALHSERSNTLSTSDVRRVLTLSFQAWEQVVCAGAVGVQADQLAETAECGDPEYNSRDGNMNTIIFVHDWSNRSNHDSRAYALTTVWHNTKTGEIYDADMEINETNFRFGTCPAPRGCTDGTVDLQNVITHEAGHYFGLAHTPDSELATMWATAAPGSIDKRTLEEDDEAGFCDAYGVGKLVAECNSTPPGGRSLTCGDNGGGCAIPVGTPAHPSNAWFVLVGLLMLRRCALRRSAKSHRLPGPDNRLS